MRNQFGFSLVELVAVIVLIAILSVFIAPRISGTSGYDEHVIRDQLVSALRFAQQQALYDQAAGNCYRVNITTRNYVIERSTNGGGFVQFDPYNPGGFGFGFGEGDSSVRAALDKVTLSVTTPPAATPLIYFDGLGNSVISCTDRTVVQKRINIVGGATLSLCIYPTGYINAAACPV